MIRRYCEGDIHQIVSLELETLGTTLGEEMLKNDLDNDLAYYFVYEEDNEVKGYISLTYDGYQGEILNFCVKKELQGKGIGTKLICHSIDYLYSLGAESFILEVRRGNSQAIGLYTKLGFKEISVRKGYYNNGEDALVLLKQMVPYQDVEDAYLEIYCKFDKKEDYTYIHCDTHPTKYYFNFYRVHDSKCIPGLIHASRSFLQLELDNPYDGMYSFPESCEGIRYHASIHSLHALKKTDYVVKKLDESQRDLFHGFMYLDSLQFGDKFAKDNAREFLDAHFEKNRLDWYIVYSDGIIVGTVSAAKYLDTVKLEDFFILDEYQHQGYGSALMSYAILDLKNQGIHDVYLTADASDTVNEMYQRMGFTEIAREYVVREVFE